MFVNDDGYDCRRLEENIKVSKTCCKDANDAYLVQVDKLKGLAEVVEKRKMELLQVGLHLKNIFAGSLCIYFRPECRKCIKNK